MLSIRSYDRLREFVEKLIAIEQKAKRGLEFVMGESDVQRVVALFRENVVDDRQLAIDLQATIDDFDQFLFEQDRPFYEPAGLTRKQWSERVHGSWQMMFDWQDVYSPVLNRVLEESRQDVARFVVVNVVADLAGKRVRKYARDAGWDRTEEGGVNDFLTGVGVNAGVGAALDQATDPTKAIVARLSDEMVRAEQVALHDKYGLFAELRRLQGAHEKARQALVTQSNSK